MKIVAVKVFVRSSRCLWSCRGSWAKRLGGIMNPQNVQACSVDPRIVVSRIFDADVLFEELGPYTAKRRKLKPFRPHRLGTLLSLRCYRAFFKVGLTSFMTGQKFVDEIFMGCFPSAKTPSLECGRFFFLKMI